MGVDTADDHWDITISHQERKGDPNLHRLVFVGKMSPRDGLYFLHELVDRYNVVCTVIDHGPQTLQARAFQNEANAQYGDVFSIAKLVTQHSTNTQMVQ